MRLREIINLACGFRFLRVFVAVIQTELRGSEDWAVTLSCLKLLSLKKDYLLGLDQVSHNVWHLQTANCKLQTTDYRLHTVDLRPWIIRDVAWLTAGRKSWRAQSLIRHNPCRFEIMTLNLTTRKTIWVCVDSVTLKCRRRWRWPWKNLDWQRSVSLYPFRADSCEIHRRLIKNAFKNKAKTCFVVWSLWCFLWSHNEACILFTFCSQFDNRV